MGGTGKLGTGNVIGGPGAAAPVARINNRQVGIVRGPRLVFRNFTRNPVRRLAGPDALATVGADGQQFAADGFVAVGRPVCRGRTAEGCLLRWEMILTGDGGTEPQCVQYCRPDAAGAASQPAAEEPSADSEPSTPTAAQAGPVYAQAGGDAPVAGGSRCEVTVFAQANFAGDNSDTTEDHPELEQLGWAKEIASIRITRGTWDFYADRNYTGDTLRLGPGSYSDLGIGWTRQIASFMCAQP
jgi:hypothetical protein